MSGKYDDIIDLPHHVSATRPRMSIHDRAAQFMPFAALTGHDGAIRETARLTDRRLDLTEDAIDELNRKLQLLRDTASTGRQVRVTYFLPDPKKDGGAYVEYTGALRRVDDAAGELIFQDGTRIAVEDIVDGGVADAKDIE